jgi:glycosyltransferase involved in cell wall biosynthesis
VYEGLEQVTVISENISDEALLLYYQRSKGLLLSFLDCTASNSILEALACGCPLITNNVGAVLDYIPEDSGVPVFETSAIEDSVEYIVRLLQDAVFLNTISEKQRTLALKYDWKIIAKSTEDFILS